MTTLAEAIAAVTTAFAAANAASPMKVDFFVSAPKPNMDNDGAAHPYHVLHPSPGTSVREEETLCASPGPRLWRFQMTCAGGDPDRALRALQRCVDVLSGRQLVPTSGFIREEGDLGPLRLDQTVTPNRWFAPIDYAVEL